MVVDRERAIRDFVPLPYHALTLYLTEHKGVEAPLVVKPWAEDEKHVVSDAIAAQLAGEHTVRLVGVRRSEVSVKHREPLTTVTMQSVCGTLFGLSPKETMKAAQSLFEQGAITYHRTDNPNISDDGFAMAVAQLQKNGLSISTERPVFKAKADAQEAHEAIRPTDFGVLKTGDSEEQRQVYSIIRERALLLGMPIGSDAVTHYLFRTHKQYQAVNGSMQHVDYLAKGKVITTPGWRAGVRIEPVDTKDKLLPNLTEGEDHMGLVKSAKKETLPPSRFTEPTLTKALERAGIGRPSTYASILENIKARNYVAYQRIGSDKGKKKTPPLAPTELGEYVVDALINLQFMNYKYTRQVEASLDKVAAGKMGYPNIVGPVLKQIQDDIEYRLSTSSLVKETLCPACGLAVIQRSAKKDKTNVFWVHKDRAHSESCHTFLDDSGGSPTAPEPIRTSLCVSCGDTITRRYSKRKSSHYWIHSQEEPTCGNLFLSDLNGEPHFETAKHASRE